MESIEEWFHSFAGDGSAVLFDPECVDRAADYKPLLELLVSLTGGEMSLSRFWAVARGGSWRVQFRVAGERAAPVKLRDRDGMADLRALLVELNGRAARRKLHGRFAMVGSEDCGELVIVGWIPADAVDVLQQAVQRRRARRTDVYGSVPSPQLSRV